MKSKEIKRRREEINEILECTSLNRITLSQPIAGDVIEVLRRHIKTLMRYVVEDQERIDKLSRLVRNYKDIEDIMRPLFKKQVSEVTDSGRQEDRISWDAERWIDKDVEQCTVFIPEPSELVKTAERADDWDGDESVDA